MQRQALVRRPALPRNMSRMCGHRGASACCWLKRYQLLSDRSGVNPVLAGRVAQGLCDPGYRLLSRCATPRPAPHLRARHPGLAAACDDHVAGSRCGRTSHAVARGRNPRICWPSNLSHHRRERLAYLAHLHHIGDHVRRSTSGALPGGPPAVCPHASSTARATLRHFC